MYRPSKKTVYLAMAFAAIAGVAGTYVYWEDVSFAVCDAVYPEANTGEARLVDDRGIRYTLLNHGDGKETALYDDDKSVTFHRDGTGNLVWDAGLAGLIPTIATGYYAFHGFAAPTARMDASSMTYRLTSPLGPYEEVKREDRSSGGYNPIFHGSTLAGSRYNEKSRRADSIGQKSGFGGAGMRSGSS